MKGILKWPLIVTAIVVVLRVIVERAGAPPAVSNMLSVAALTTVLGPLYFALQVGLARKPHPNSMLIRLIFIKRPEIIPVEGRSGRAPGSGSEESR